MRQLGLHQRARSYKRPTALTPKRPAQKAIKPTFWILFGASLLGAGVVVEPEVEAAAEEPEEALAVLEEPEVAEAEPVAEALEEPVLVAEAEADVAIVSRWLAFCTHRSRV